MMAPSETPGTTARNRIRKFTIYQALTLPVNLRFYLFGYKYKILVAAYDCALQRLNTAPTSLFNLGRSGSVND